MCKVTKLEDGRKVVVGEDDNHIIKIDNVNTRIEGVLVTDASVAIMKKPHVTAFHKEYMLQHGLAMYRGLETCDADRILDNMLEAVEVVE